MKGGMYVCRYVLYVGEGMRTDSRNEGEGTDLGWVFEVK